MAGEYDPAWTFRPTCLGRRIHPNMIPSSQRQLLPLLNHQTPDKEARDTLAIFFRPTPLGFQSVEVGLPLTVWLYGTVQGDLGPS